MNAVTSPDVLLPQPPGPKGGVFSAALRWRYNRNPLEFLSSMARDYGDIVHLRWGRLTLYLLNHPDFIQAALLDSERTTSDDCPGFTQHNGQAGCALSQHIDTVEAQIATLAEDVISSLPTGWSFDLQRAWMRFSAAVVLQASFSTHSPVLVEDIVQAMYRLTLTAPLGLFSTHHNWIEIRPVRRAIAMFDTQLKDLLRSCGRTAADQCSVCILIASDILTSVLTWSSVALAQQSDIQFALQSQVDQVAGNLPLTNTDLNYISLIGQVLRESLRCYPPVWAINREVNDEIHLGNYCLERGARVVASPWVVQRDVRFYPDAQRFDLHRWEHASQLDQLDGAYFPFGGDRCAPIMMRLAWLAGRMAIATLARHWTAILIGGRGVIPQASLSLRSKNGLPVILSRRVY